MAREHVLGDWLGLSPVYLHPVQMATPIHSLLFLPPLGISVTFSSVLEELVTGSGSA